MTLNRVWIPSPNYSSRGGTAVRLVVVHTAEGARTYPDLGAFFANPASGVSSQTGIDDTPGTVGEYVRRDMKPWTQANANPHCTATELCAFAEWDNAEWQRHPNMLANCAAWIAEECAAFGIPVRKLSAAQAQGGQAGVCGHVDLGVAGGNHWDPGPSFPWDQVLDMAAGGGGEDDEMTEADFARITDIVAKQVNDALRQQFRPEGECYGRVVSADTDALRRQFAPEGECYGRVMGADAEAIRRTPANIPPSR